MNSDTRIPITHAKLNQKIQMITLWKSLKNIFDKKIHKNSPNRDRLRKLIEQSDRKF
jgi:hypothetical protein